MPDLWLLTLVRRRAVVYGRNPFRFGKQRNMPNCSLGESGKVFCGLVPKHIRNGRAVNERIVNGCIGAVVSAPYNCAQAARPPRGLTQNRGFAAGGSRPFRFGALLGKPAHTPLTITSRETPHGAPNIGPRSVPCPPHLIPIFFSVLICAPEMCHVPSPPFLQQQFSPTWPL